jgi:hypothetical protein
MAVFNKYETFVTDLGNGTHDNAVTADTDTLKVALTNTAPNAATHAVLADITELGAGNGYTAGGSDTTNAASEASGTITVAGTDVVFTASGGSIGPFRYVVLYNDTPTSPADPLIGWWDYGSAATVTDGNTFTVDFGASMFTLS